MRSVEHLPQHYYSIQLQLLVTDETSSRLLRLHAEFTPESCTAQEALALQAAYQTQAEQCTQDQNCFKINFVCIYIYCYKRQKTCAVARWKSINIWIAGHGLDRRRRGRRAGPRWWRYLKLVLRAVSSLPQHLCEDDDYDTDSAVVDSERQQ